MFHPRVELRQHVAFKQADGWRRRGLLGDERSMNKSRFRGADLARCLPWLLALAGSVLGLWLVLRQGWREIFHLLLLAGWPLLWIVPLHVLPLALDASSWRILLAPRDRRPCAGVGFLLWVTVVREAVARLLPLASVGGELVGIRLVWGRGLDAAVVTASVVMQLLVSLVNQYLLAALGVMLMLSLSADAHLGRLILYGLLLTAPLPLAVWFLLHYGRLFERAQQLLRRLLGARVNALPALAGAAVDHEFRAYGARPRRLMAALLVELAGLCLGAAENWLALRLLGHGVSPLVALALEAALQAARHLFFMVPGSLGVQEGGLLLFGSVFGVPADLSIALSLAKRLREVALGLPALLSWQLWELRRLKRTKMPVATESSASRSLS